MKVIDAYHIPVMLEECIEGMKIHPEGCYVDLTFGGGGHSRYILQQLGSGGRLYAFDQDADAACNALDDPRFTFVASNFRHLDRFMDYYGQIGKVDAVLADLGVSSHHFDEASRGFSFRSRDALLDMRMNTRAKHSAREILAEYSEESLAHIFYTYGELRQSKRLAQLIVSAREKKELRSTGDLLEVVAPAIAPRDEKKQLSCLFQAIRIEVNQEMQALEEMLHAVTQVLKPGGRFVVMTYHSLEDRLVKNFLRSTAQSPDPQAEIYGRSASLWQLITRKPITPSIQELEHNPRSRSAKLRIAERKASN